MKIRNKRKKEKKMKQLYFGFVVFAIIFVSLTKPADAKVEIGLSGDYAAYSSYIWRGFELDSDPVVQTGLNFSLNCLTLSVWNSMDIDAEDSLGSDEMDYMLDITKSFGDITVSLGNTIYTFPSADLESKELYLAIAYDSFLAPSISCYKDYGDESDGGGDGTYISLALSYGKELSNITSMSLSTAYGYNDELFIAGSGSDLLLGLSLEYSGIEGLTVSPNINYSMPFADLEDENDGAQEATLYGGFSVGYEF